jgi:exodeoxyribonuclease V beta subunit
MTATQDWRDLPLEPGGRSLVEASAGTGKTWTIAALYLRLLLQYELSPRQIVVATFTNAAAAELAGRLRARLLWAQALAAGRPLAGDHQASDRVWLEARWQGEAGKQQQDEDARRLQAALAELDAAPIGTLHALCARILAEHPFAAGVSFRGQRLVDAEALRRQLEEDLWRYISQGSEDDVLVRLARQAGMTRQKLKDYLPVLMQPDVQLDADQDRLDLCALLKDDNLPFLANLADWAERSRALVNQYAKARTHLLEDWPVLLDALAAPQEDSRVLECMASLANLASLKTVRKDALSDPRMQALAEDARQLHEALSRHVWQLELYSQRPQRAFLAAAQRWCQQQLQARLTADGQATFDTLLTSVREALKPHPQTGQRPLADALCVAWPVALVDEFQDTDPVQFSILDAIYRESDGRPRGRLVMIGDPKQAIYRFRGGDVDAYQRASNEVPASDRLILGTNHRSSRAYVEAVNQFYAETGHALAEPGAQTQIHYQPVQPSSRRDATPLCHADGTPVQRPLVLHAGMSETLDEGPALRACAKQIAWALSEAGYRIGDARLQPGDIAVLLPNHQQIARLAALLRARAIPCAVTSPRSVFDSDCADELQLVLHAVLHADDPRALRAALATRLLGGDLATLQALAGGEGDWDAISAQFHHLHDRLLRHGPLALVAALLEQQAARLLATVVGERMLTDLRHLGELLQEAWLTCGSGERLLAWLADQRKGVRGGVDADASDARLQRLESDAARVQLMTLHASKGLEFGVVYLPLMWDHSGNSGSRGPRLLADPHTGQKQLVLSKNGKECVQAQESQERYRMLYVALTRAIHACHVFVPAANGGSGTKKTGAPITQLPLEKLRHLADDPSARIAWLDGWEPPAVQAGTWRAAATVVHRQARSLPMPRPLPMRHSFSTLVAGGRHGIDTEAAAGDETLAEPAMTAPLESPEVVPHSALEALAEVSGIEFGNAIHAVFEHRPAGEPISQAMVLDALREYGVRPRNGDLETLAQVLAGRLQAVLETPLLDTGLRLDALRETDMRAELGFHYVLEGASLQALRQVCATHGEPDLVPARDQPLLGLMSGKIDLVFRHDGRFHLLDYKGNRLSDPARPNLLDYAPDAIAQAMAASGYRLQALLYTLALERYLRERLGAGYQRARDLGDCWYLFIRAVGLRLPDGTPCGVWRHRFDDALLDAAQAVLGLTLQEVA